MTDFAIESDFRLGKLLVEMDLVTRTRVEQAVVLSSLTTLPLGKLLSMLDYVPERLIKSSIEAQSMLRDRLIKMDLARKAMYLVRSSNISFSDALTTLGFEYLSTSRSRLGELLTDSQKLGKEQLEFALSISNSSGLPLGQIFILMNKITEDFLRMALALQRELRSGNIERERVIARLASADKADQTANCLPSQNTERVKLGELLTTAGFIDKDRLQEATEIASSLNMLLGEFLIQKSVIERDVLTLALKLQSQVWQSKLTLYEAGRILKDAATYLKETDFKALPEKIELFHFLRLSGYLTNQMIEESLERMNSQPRLIASIMKHSREDCDSATKLALSDSRTLRIVLAEIYPEDRAIIDSGLVLHKLVLDGKMSLQEALFNFSIKRSGALKDFNDNI